MSGGEEFHSTASWIEERYAPKLGKITLDPKTIDAREGPEAGGWDCRDCHQTAFWLFGSTFRLHLLFEGVIPCCSCELGVLP